MNDIITIGREFGSGGRELGKRLADHLGFAYYDQEIVTEIAQRTALSETYVKEILERRPPMSYPIRIGHTLHTGIYSVQSQAVSIMQEQFKILREMAAASNCVIVGRCADYILREMEPFRIFVYADMPHKIQRCRQKGEEHEDMSDLKLTRMIRGIDKQRAIYYNHITDQKWGTRSNYDLLINTTHLTPKLAAFDLASMIRKHIETRRQVL